MKKFTLLELAIVLGILAAIASVLLDNFATVKLQEYHKQTLERGELVQNAMLGRNTQTGFSEFLSDMGRWPKIYIDTEESDFSRNLAELYDYSIWDEDMFNHTETVEIDYNLLGISEPSVINYVMPTLKMQVGWSGSYLNRNFTAKDSFNDAWGNPWRIMTGYYLKNKLEPTFTTITEDSSATTAEIDGIISYGGNNVADDSEDEDVNIVDADSEFEFSFNRNYASLNITLKVRDEDEPKKWNTVKILDVAPDTEVGGTIPSFATGDSYYAGEMVYVDISGKIHYYTATAYTEGATPFFSTGDYTVANSNWRYGASANYYVSSDQVKLLLFSPTKISNSMQVGVFRCAPYLDIVSDDDTLYPALYSIGEDNKLSDADDDVKDVSVTSEGYIETRQRTELSWEYTADSTDISTLRLSWLVPGRRQIYFFGSFEDNTFIASDLENIELKSGENYITIYLEQKR